MLEMEAVPVLTWMPVLLGIWGFTAALFIGGNILIDALGKMIEKANLTITQNNTATTNISGNIGGGK
jgi:hypothetical protein